MLYLCRHGQTLFNRERRIQGHRESELTPLGERQAVAMANLLHDLVKVDPPATWRLMSSPLGRARQTAGRIAARLGLAVEIDPRLIEISVGDWEGRLTADLAREHPAVFADRSWVFQAPGGETYDDVLRRVSSWLAEQVVDANRRLIVVSHGVAGRLLRGAYAGLSQAQTIDQDAPQDAILRLSRGQIDRLDCEPVD